MLADRFKRREFLRKLSHSLAQPRRPLDQRKALLLAERLVSFSEEQHSPQAVRRFSKEQMPHSSIRGTTLRLKACKGRTLSRKPLLLK
jgi:hypothetical protein